jgi:hypothetical protein
MRTSAFFAPYWLKEGVDHRVKPGDDDETISPILVMAGLDPAIHALLDALQQYPFIQVSPFKIILGNQLNFPAAWP